MIDDLSSERTYHPLSGRCANQAVVTGLGEVGLAESLLISSSNESSLSGNNEDGRAGDEQEDDSLRSQESALELTGMDVEDPLREESDVEATGTADAMHVVNPSQVESDVDSTEDVDVIVYRAPLGDFADW